jgi:uncharacterized YigZ family protein
MNELIPEKDFIYRYTILNSLFIALLLPLQKEEELSSRLGKIKKDYPKASHYCYAAKVLSFEACSDDGEPSRSAGVPFLDLLHKKEIAYGLLVVVRYFGGTKLGAGRLARVYRETAANCVNEATFAEIIPGLEVEIEVDYPTFENLKARGEKAGLEIKPLSFDERVRLLLRGDAKIVPSWLEALPSGSVLVKKAISIQRSGRHDSEH